MDPTPVTTVHAGTAARRGRRREGVGRASVRGVLAAAALAGALAGTLLPAGVLAAKPSMPPGQETKDAPSPPVVTPAPIPTGDPTADVVVTTAGVTTGADGGTGAFGGATMNDRPTGGASGPPDGSALPIALGGGALVGVIGGLVLLVMSRHRREDESTLAPVDPAPPPDPEQLLADALAAHGTRRASVGEAERLPVWVRRLDPEMPILPTLQNAPGEIDDPGERRTGRFVARPDVESGETY